MQASFDSTPAGFAPLPDDLHAPRSWPWTLYSWAVVFLGLLTGAFLCVVVGGVAALSGDRRRRVAHAMLAFGFRGIARLRPRVELRVTGTENLPAVPCILCPNHESYADVVFLYWLPLHFKWIVKKELFDLPVFGAAMRVAGYPMIERGDPESAVALVRRVTEALDAGVSVLSFPEGTRSADGTLGRFQSGTARMALASGAPLVPVGVVGTTNVLPRGRAMYPARLRIAIHVGPPIPVGGHGPREVRSLTRRLRAAVMEAKRAAQHGLESGSRVDEGLGVGY